MHQDRPEWWDFAACLGVDPDLFFPERGASTREAKEVCRGCPVREVCLAEHVAEEFGIWGGLSERERRKIRPHRYAAVAVCGTNSGYEKHRRLVETACQPCLDAHNAHVQRHDPRYTGTGHGGGPFMPAGPRFRDVLNMPLDATG